MFSVLSRRPWRRLNVRLALWHSALFLVSMLGVLALAWFALRERVEEQDRDQVLFRHSQFSNAYRNRGLKGVMDLAAWRKGRAQNAAFVRIADPDNQTLYIRDADDWIDFSPLLELRPAPTGDGLNWLQLSTEDGDELLLAEQRLADGTIVQLGKSTEQSKALLWQFRTVTLTLVAICIPLSFLGGTILAARGLQPLRSLAQTVAEIEATSRFSARAVESGSGDELDELARVFNAAMGRIERLLRTMRESLDNVAHDLRTPMTRLLHRAQACLEEGADPAALRDALAECVEEAETVLQMLHTLMDIAEAESGLVKSPPSALDAHSVVGGACALYEEVAEDKRIALQNIVPEGTWVQGDPVMLRRVFANLLDNALKYTGEGGTVRVSFRREASNAVISVADSGIGIAGEDLPKVWERLFRADRSRSQRGLGLGLSFVKAIVEAQGGRVWAESQLGSGSQFFVELPASSGET